MASFLKRDSDGCRQEKRPAGGTALLSLNAVTVGVGRAPLLAEVSLALQPGELIALTGPSGSGKTTLLRAVAGLISPLAGDVLLTGRRPEDLGWPEYRRNVVLVQQQPALLDVTVAGNLERAFSYQVASRCFSADRACWLLERLGIESGRMVQQARSLSSGEQQRVCLARGLLVEPRVLLLDEPTAALDEETEAAVEELVSEETSRRGAGAVVVTHDRRQAERWCDRTVDLSANMHGLALAQSGTVGCDG